MMMAKTVVAAALAVRGYRACWHPWADDKSGRALALEAERRRQRNASIGQRAGRVCTRTHGRATMLSSVSDRTYKNLMRLQHGLYDHAQRPLQDDPRSTRRRGRPGVDFRRGLGRAPRPSRPAAASRPRRADRRWPWPSAAARPWRDAGTLAHAGHGRRV